MLRRTLSTLAVVLCLALALTSALTGQSGRSYGPNRVSWDANQNEQLPWEEEYDTPEGLIQIVNKNGAVKAAGHPFFTALGKNGRACVTCHQPSNAMSLSAAVARQRWAETSGRDPLFAAIDGANCPDQPQDKAASHSLLLSRGLFRIGLTWPPPQTTPEFRLEVVRDPANCNTPARRNEISVYRRPRMAANLTALTPGPSGAVLMTDGREPTLRDQAVTAALIHEEAPSAPTAEQLRLILDFENNIYAAARSDLRGGLVDEPTAPPILGARNIAAGQPVTLLAASRAFESWRAPAGPHDGGLQRRFRESAVRGSALFDQACGSCHQPGRQRWMDAGTTTYATPEAAPADLPVFRLTCPDHVVYTTDPGRALITGKCADIGLIVMPQLRALSARAPYFAGGTAPTLRDVIAHYERRFQLRYSDGQREDLLNFLRTL